MLEVAPELAAALVLLVYIELRVVATVKRAVWELESARATRRSDLEEQEGHVPTVPPAGAASR